MYSYRKVSDNNHQGEKDNKEGNTVCSDTGKVFRVKVETLDKKYAGCTKTCNVRLLCIPKVVPHIEEKPPTPILKKTCRINYIKRKAEINDIIYKEEWKEDLLDKIDRYLIRVVLSVLRSDKKCTVEFILNG
jgi:hypothetical protein